ncbi:MAG: hypothetical protein HY238_06110, partial [Acidobacteria bacterium]|nr:hypothetical protein [Acidobacteriota bacterium]
MIHRAWVLCLLAGALWGAGHEPYARFDPAAGTWTLGNDQVSAAFQLTPEGSFRFLRVSNLSRHEEWFAAPEPPAAPFGVVVDGRILDGAERYRLVSQSVDRIDRRGLRQTIVLEHLEIPARIRFEVEMYPGQPVLRYRSWLENLGNQTFWVSEARMIDWRFAAAAKSYRAFQVNQWVNAGRDGNFERIGACLSRAGPAALSLPDLGLLGLRRADRRKDHAAG